MDLQNTFYLLGIIYMISGIVLLLGIVVLLFYIKKKVGDIHKFAEMRINEITALAVKPVQKAAEMARSILPKPTKKSSKKR